MYRVIKLLNGETVMGSVENVPTENGNEILVKKPYCAAGGAIMPYMVMEIGSSPGAIQLHPMNIMWAVPLDEFPEAERAYIEATSPIIMP